MKKIVFSAACVMLSITAIAQRMNIQSALNSMTDKEYEKALEYINKALNDPSTANDPKAWFVKGEIYMQMFADPKYKGANSNFYKEAARDFMKAQEIKPKYNDEEISQYMVVCMGNYFNDGVNAYNNKQLDSSASLMKTFVEIFKEAGGETAGVKQLDTMVAEARFIRANSIYYTGKYAESIPLLEEVKNNPITRKPSVYASLIDAYDKQQKTADEANVIQEGRKYFPDDATIRNDEINYYIKSGKQQDLIKKLEEAAAKEPDNPELQYNLATAYYEQANPKTGNKPANVDELDNKADESYQKAIKIAPDNPVYNYNYGSLFFNEASDVNNEMIKLGTSPDEMRKYDAMKVKADALFNKALPYLDKAYTTWDAESATLKGEDKDSYYQVMVALKQIYAMQSKMDKVEELKKKITAFK